MTFGSVLRVLRTRNNLTQKELGIAVGLSESTIGMYERGHREPDFETLEAFADYFNVDMDYLTGRSSVERIHPVTIECPQPIPGAFEVPATKRIPLLGRIAAGLPLYAEENMEGYIWTDKNHGAEYFGLRVIGDSMNAAGIKDGDVVVVRKQEELNPNEIGVILVDDSATIKRMQRKGSLVILNPQSTNPDNTPQMYDLKEHTIKVIGKVVESRTEYN